jgi:uncharacterized protein with HEPN domain
MSEKLVGFMQDVDESAYLGDEMRRLAAERLIEIIGEAATHVSEGTRTRMPEVPWKEMSNTRNRLIHDYGRIDNRLVYKIATESIPSMVRSLKAAVGRSWQ